MAWWELFRPQRPPQAAARPEHVKSQLSSSKSPSLPPLATKDSKPTRQSTSVHNNSSNPTADNRKPICCGVLLKRGLTGDDMDEVIKLVETKINPIYLPHNSDLMIRAQKEDEELFMIFIPRAHRHVIQELRAHPKIAVVCDTYDRPLFEFSWTSEARRPCNPMLNAFHLALYPPTKLRSDIPVFVVDGGVDPTHSDFIPGQIKELGLEGDLKHARRPPRRLGATHGTFVASLIGGKQVGIAPGHDIISVRVNDNDDRISLQSIRTALQSIKRYIDNDPHERRCGGIVNMSFGGCMEPWELAAIEPALNDLRDRSILLVGAAGNEPESAAVSRFPGIFPSILIVGSTDGTSKESWFSSAGHRVDLFAPGKVCGANVGSGLLSWVWEPKFRWNQGTSFSAPIVCGLALQFLAQEDIDPQTLKLRMLAAAKHCSVQLRNPHDPAHAAPLAGSRRRGLLPAPNKPDDILDNEGDEADGEEAVGGDKVSG